ncbi:MAG: DUF1295 domain-containing protein [Bacilli bacterium]|nr:DUF1295 domain-containing protein [Bacilli bacterium]
MKNKKSFGLIMMGITYILAIAFGISFYLILDKFTSMSDIFKVLLSDILSTIIVYISSLIFKTSSMYDPYWSIQSFVIFLSLLIKYQGFNPSNIIILFVLGIYSIRLTGNFIIGFDSLSYVDWRYRMLKERSEKAFQLINFFGIMMFPTIVVFLMSIPLIYMAKIEIPLYLAIIFASLMIIAILLELISDTQMKRFINNRESKSDVTRSGLWNYSRHPNYLGEITFWFMIAIPLLIFDITLWWTILGAIINLLMFLFISIPMEEKHFKEYKPDYQNYKKEVSMLLILPHKKHKEE